MRKNHFSIVHGQGLLSGLVAVLLKRMFKIKAFITLLALYDFDSMHPLFRRVVKFTFSQADIIFVEGENGKKNIENLVALSKVRSFSHWCDQTIFRPPANRDSRRTRVLFIGRPIKEKGRHIIEEAQKLLDPERFEFTYVENAPKERLPDIYKMADICVVPSLYDEGYSRVVVESASCGCGLIVSDRGSLREQVKDFGVVCDPTPKSFAHDIYFSSNPSILNVLSIEYAQEHFSPRNAEVFLNEYANH